MFDFDGRKAMSVFMVENVVENDTQISTQELVDTILDLIAPLITDQEDGPKAEQWDDPEEFSEEQSMSLMSSKVSRAYFKIDFRPGWKTRSSSRV